MDAVDMVKNAAREGRVSFWDGKNLHAFLSS
jgi:hypothetical protein